MTSDHERDSRERADLLETLEKQRGFLRYTVKDLTDEQAAGRHTVSELSLGGIIKHVAQVEDRWADFIVQGPSAMGSGDQESMERRAAGFRMTDGDTLSGLLADYERVAGRTNELLHKVPSMDDSQPLPEAPWFPPGARWTVRRVFAHLISETAQHCGHADIIREAIDGSKTMG